MREAALLMPGGCTWGAGGGSVEIQVLPNILHLQSSGGVQPSLQSIVVVHCTQPVSSATC